MREITLKLTEEEAKYVRVALDREGDVQLDNGDKERSDFLYGLAAQLRENGRDKMDEIKQELFELRMYIEDQYTERYGWSVDGEEVLKRVYQLMELVHGKAVGEPLVEYKDE